MPEAFPPVIFFGCVGFKLFRLFFSSQILKSVENNILLRMAEYQSIKPIVLAALEEHMAEIRMRFGIESLGIFGSVARGEDTPDSDVDVLYLFQDGRGSMNTIIPLMHYLEDLFGRRVDLVSLNYISPLIEEYVKADAILCGLEAVV